jgi:hypothetical protein
MVAATINSMAKRAGKDAGHEKQPNLQNVGIFYVRKIKDCTLRN